MCGYLPFLETYQLVKYLRSAKYSAKYTDDGIWYQSHHYEKSSKLNISQHFLLKLKIFVYNSRGVLGQDVFNVFALYLKRKK